jgi:hypothetical protein
VQLVGDLMRGAASYDDRVELWVSSRTVFPLHHAAITEA